MGIATTIDINKELKYQIFIFFKFINLSSKINVPTKLLRGIDNRHNFTNYQLLRGKNFYKFFHFVIANF